MRPLVSLAALLVASPFATAQLGANHCHATPNSTGAPATLRATGTADVAVNDVVLHGAALPPGALSMLLSSTERAWLPGFAGTATTLCLGGALGRHVSTLGVADPSGMVVMPIDTQQVPHPTQPFALERGDTLNFQLWFRDTLTGGGATSGLSDGLSITFCPEAPFGEDWFPLPVSSSFALASDLDQDGLVDSVFHTGTSINIYFALPGGGFAPRVDVPSTTPSVASVIVEVAVDLDGNGLVDLLGRVSNAAWLSGRLVVILQTGPRQFAPPRLLTPTDWYLRPSVADVDGDGVSDVVAVHSGLLAVHVLRGDGVGDVEAPLLLDVPVGQSFRNVGVADLDLDGRSEVYATTSWLMVRVYAWAGAAGLTHTATRVVGPERMVFFDVEGDGDLDYVAPSSAGTSVLRNLGGGVLATFQERYASPQGTFETYEDVEGDGDVDLVFQLFQGDLHTLWNDGTGLFYPTIPADIGVPQVARSYVDVDGDGRFEAVDLIYAGSLARIRRRVGPEAVEPYDPPPPITVTSPSNAALDVDGDGFEELVGFLVGEVDIASYPAGWSAPQSVRYTGVGPYTGAAFGDVDGDRDLDLVALGQIAGVTRLTTHLQVGPLDFAPTSSFPVASALQNVVSGDLDGDGDSDAVLTAATGSLVHVYLRVGGLWQGPVVSDVVELDPPSMVVEDVTGDGVLDIVYSRWTGPQVCEGRPGGRFVTSVPIGAVLATSGARFLLADLDGDGATDLIHRNTAGSAFVVHRRIGPNHFAAGVLHAVGSAFLGAFDLEGDGDLDLFATSSSLTMTLLANRGDGTFEAPRTLFTGFGTSASPVAGDFDLDGDRDIVFSEGGVWRVLENRCR